MAWTDKMVEDLKKLWLDGLSTSEIAKKLGISKNSVVGKVHRLSLSGRPSPIKKKEEEIERAAAARAKKIKETQAKEALAVEIEEETITVSVEKPATKAAVRADNLIRVTDLDSHTCRWPLGDPRDENFHFCGKKVRTGQTYCDEHSAIAYVKPIKK